MSDSEGYSGSYDSNSEKEIVDREEEIIERFKKDLEGMGYRVQEINTRLEVNEINIKINNKWYVFDTITGKQIDNYDGSDDDWDCVIL